MGNSSGKPVALVTGASSGIGETTVRRFAAGGYDIVALARRKDRLEQLARDLSGICRVEILAADVTAKDTPERAVAIASSGFGG